MGLFSRHHSPQPPSHPSSSTKVYVFIRCPDNLPSTTSTWSLVVSEERRSPPRSQTHDGHHSHQEQQHPSKSRGSLFSFKSSKDSRIDSYSETDSHQDDPVTTDVHEFTLSSDNLSVTHQVQQHPPTSDHTDPTSIGSNSNEPSSSILLKILVPHTAPDSHQPLSTQIESSLRKNATTTSATPTSTSSPQTTNKPPPAAHKQFRNFTFTTTTPSPLSSSNKTDLTTLLTTLQTSNPPILPQPPTFTIPKFIEYAQNNFSSFHQEITTTTTTTTPQNQSLETSHVRVSDYTAHLAENARLRAHFGHNNTNTNDNDNDYYYYSSRHGNGEQGGVAHIQTGMGSGWWVSRPMDLDARRREREVSRDVYAGLM